MATIFLIHCNRQVSGVQYPGISSIAAFVRKYGHEFHFFDTGNYAYDMCQESNKHCEGVESRIDLEFKQIENKEAISHKKHISKLLTDLEYEITRSRINIVGISSFSDDWPLALFLIRKVTAILPNVPVIVGGVHASIVPEQVIKHPEVDMVCVGEGELPIVELLNSLDRGTVDITIKNLWIKDTDNIIKNPQRSLLQFEEDFPMLDWTDYNDSQFIYPFEGRLYRRGSVFIGRGCPYSCKFCVNFLKNTSSIYSGQLPFKDVAFIIEELSYLKNEYSLEFLRFWDETFLAKPKEYLMEFAKAYKKYIGLPFTIETTAQTINHENVKMLAEMGCKSISIGVETSNENLRMKVLGKRITNETYDQCFDIITEYGLRKVANFMFFLPHQTLDDMWNDVYMSAKWKIENPSARVFYPYVGTGLREYCIEHDMIDLDLIERIEDEESIQDINMLSNKEFVFKGMAPKYDSKIICDTVLRFDSDTKEKAMRILDNFILFQKTEPTVHPYLSQLLIKDDINSNRDLRKIERDIYKKRFGGELLV